MNMVHDAFVQTQSLALDTDRWKLDPIQCEIWEAMIKSMKKLMKYAEADHEFYTQAQHLHVELEKHSQYFETQGKKTMANEIMHLQLKAAYKHDKIKLEAMIFPHTPSYTVWKNLVCFLLESDGGYEQKGVEPRGDLERKKQSWVDSLKRSDDEEPKT